MVSDHIGQHSVLQVKNLADVASFSGPLQAQAFSWPTLTDGGIISKSKASNADGCVRNLHRGLIGVNMVQNGQS